MSRRAISLVITLVSLSLIALWEASKLDLWIAAHMGSAQGFALRDNLWLTRLGHDGARLVAAALVIAVAFGIARPWGPLRTLPRSRRWWFALTVVSGMLVVSVLKRFSATSCPWDLQPFGGTWPFVAHWRLGQFDGGPGHCFPAGHASAAFAWVAGYFAWPARSRSARAWLIGSVAAGLLLGLFQQLRGAHFMSHTLWTGWLCWAWAWGLSFLLDDSDHAPAADRR